MSVLRRLYNVARGKVLVRGTDAPPDLADEPPRPPRAADPIAPAGAEGEAAERSEERPATPRPRRL